MDTASNPYFLTPSLQNDRDKDTLKRKLAMSLLMQGMNTSPVQAWTQGAARLAQALVGNRLLQQDEDEAKARELKQSNAIFQLPGMQPQVPQQSGATPVSAPQATFQPVSSGQEPASIRTNNPGAQWNGPVAQQYGATGAVPLPGGNNAASFPDPVSGAAAQFGLLNKNYAGMPLNAAIQKWSGGNSAPGYTNFVTKQTGLAPDAVLSPEVLNGPQGIKLAQSMAHWEAGKPYPMSDEQWQEAQSRALGKPAQAQYAQPGQAQVRGPMLTPEQTKEITLLWQNPETRPLALEAYRKYTVPKEQWTDLTPAELKARGVQSGITGQRNSVTGQVKLEQPMVSIQNQAENEFDKHYGAGLAKDALATLEAGNTASNELQNIKLLRSYMQNIQTGKLAPTQSTVGGWAQSVGIDPTKLGINPNMASNAEAAQALIQRMSMGMIGAANGGVPANNFSEADRKWVQSTQSSLSNRPEANEYILATKERVAEVAQEKADKWAEARSQGISYEKFERAWRKDLGSRNIFGDLIAKVEANNTPLPNNAPQDATPSVEDLVKQYGKK